MQHILNQRRFARARYTRDGDEPVERDRDVDVLEIVLRHAKDLDARIRARAWLASNLAAGTLAAGKIVGGQRSCFAVQRVGRPEKHDLAPALARARTDVENSIGSEHDLRIMLDDDQ